RGVAAEVSERTRPRDGCALVTGASRGIGAAIAIALARESWPVVVNYRSDEAGALETVAAIVADGGEACAVRGDVSREETADSLLSASRERHGPVLVLVNNAGITDDGLALSLSDEQWRGVIDTNLTAAFRLIRPALRQMIAARFGRIVNVASVVGPLANPGQASYAASKAGLIGLTRTVAAEVARRGVTVNAIAPGLIETDLTAGVADALLARVPARRAGRPEEVADCVAFLASEKAAYVTGTTLYVDGGMSA
ncbi:MAG TPA: 3-oxoacyl-ACP reductase FabG, partial [Solirubrobacteraceae bacterium]|nr:3-oxoacyl-ACP reductase FabG [Solirubrobacteraceae bacterium]